LTPTEQARLTSARTVNPEAYNAYLKGRYFVNRPSDENLKKAIAQFKESLRLDPNFAPAYSGLSDAYDWAGVMEGVLTAAETMPLAKATAEKAVELDDSSAEAHASLAGFKYNYEFDWAGSEREFRRAIELNPSYAFAHDQFGLELADLGRLDESLAEGKRATELDPLSPQVLLDTAYALAWQDKYQGAKEQAKRARDIDPAYFGSPLIIGWTDIQAGKISDAIPELQKANAMDSPTWVAGYLGYAYGAAGDHAKASAIIEEMKHKSLNGSVPPFNLALVYIGMGDRERALGSLEEAYAAHSIWLCLLKMERVFDPLRSEPRFIALIKKLNFQK